MRQQICQADYLITCPQITWSPDAKTQIGKPNAILKQGSSHKQNIIWFELLSPNRIPQQIQLIGLYQQKQHAIRRINKQVFLHEGVTKLHKLTPIKLVTKQLILFSRQQETLNVVHIPQSNQGNMTTYENKWINFVEQFSICESTLIYKLVISYQKNQSQILQNLREMFIHDRLSKMVKLLSTLPMLKEKNKMIESQIIFAPVTHSFTVSSKPCSASTKDDPNYNQQHLRLGKLSNDQKKLFCRMQQQFPTANDNQLCRFLIGKNYNLEQATKLYTKYLAWKKEALKKYTMESFKQITDKRMFIYCGKDRKGRPVVYNEAAAVIPSQLNEDLYCQFYKYYFQIYIPSKMTGYVDQMVILANGEGLGLKNFKISLTKRNMSEMLDIAPQRQAKLTAVKVNWFGTTVWSILRPLLPTKSVDKIAVYGSNKAQYMPKLEEMMDISVIPKLIGGENELLNNY